MKYLEVALLGCLAGLAGYTLCAWSPKPHIVKVMDQGKQDVLAAAPVQIIDARDPLIVALGEAIGREEGWCDEARFRLEQCKNDTLAHRLHNPGMLVWAGQVGASFIGSSPYAAFETDDAGWAALYADLRAKWSETESFWGNSDKARQMHVEAIAYNWSTGDRDRYAGDIVADLKSKGLLK